MMHAYLERESCSSHDHNSIRVELKSGGVLGHLESEIAAVLAPLMDRNIAGFAIKTYNSYYIIGRASYNWAALSVFMYPVDPCTRYR